MAVKLGPSAAKRAHFKKGLVKVRNSGFGRDCLARYFTGGAPRTWGKHHIWRISYSGFFLVWLPAVSSNLIWVDLLKLHKNI